MRRKDRLSTARQREIEREVDELYFSDENTSLPFFIIGSEADAARFIDNIFSLDNRDKLKEGFFKLVITVRKLLAEQDAKFTKELAEMKAANSTWKDKLMEVLREGTSRQ